MHCAGVSLQLNQGKRQNRSYSHTCATAEMRKEAALFSRGPVYKEGFE